MRYGHFFRTLYFFILLTGVFGFLCMPAAGAQEFACGADVSWITQMEASGYVWYNDSGSQQDVLQILKDHEINSIRLRVWVDPSDSWNGVSDVVNKAVRAQNMGFRILIDFHYSDSWADPGKQNKPPAWRSHSFSQLLSDVYQHTYYVMNALAASGVYPEWVQVGNETNDGLLWEEGRASTQMGNYAKLVNSGYDAVKAVSSSSKVIVHVSNAYDNNLFRWNIGGLIDNGARFDVIGMSLYPDADNWRTLNSQALTNMNDMRSRYGKEIIMTEVGMSWDAASTCRSFLEDIIGKTQSAGGLGVFYWEPEAYSWQGYTKGAWDWNTRRPTVAMDAFIGVNGSSSSSSSSSSTSSSSSGGCDSSGSSSSGGCN